MRAFVIRKRFFGWALLAFAVVYKCTAGVASAVPPNSGQPLLMDVKVWKLYYADPTAGELTWKPFESASESPQPVALSPKGPPAPSQASKKEVHRTPDGLIRKAFALRRKGEEMLPTEEIRSRIELFTKTLIEGLGVTRGEERDSGRRLIVKKEKDRVVLIDKELGVLKATLLYDSFFPPPVLVYPPPAQPLPSGRDLSMVISAMKTQHRSTNELESVLNRVTGRTRSQENGQVDRQDIDRMKMRVTGNDSSGHLILAEPAREDFAARRPEPAPRIVTRRVTKASVSLERAEVPRRERFRRFGPMDFSLIRSELARLGRLSTQKERVYPLSGDKPIFIEGGRMIPFLRYRPRSSSKDFHPQAVKIGATLYLIPSEMDEKACRLTVMAELIDFIDYPNLEKIYFDYETLLRRGDTLVCKKLVPDEVSEERSLLDKEAPAAETLIFLTLR